MGDREQLELAIAAQEQLRGSVPDAVIDLTIASLREKLAASPSDQRRRQATVLFADVLGFTSLAETVDAEVVVEIMNAVWARIDAVIEATGGRIDKHIGDAVMAVWGADASSEDDPEQGVRAGLELQASLALDAEASGWALEMRVGIATGPVLLGEVATTREFTAMGDTVNVAARLESAAPVGGVLISHDTYRHVRGVFDVTPQGPLHVKGRTEPVRAYVVQRAKPQSFRIPSRGVEGVETRMVGRDAEFQALQHALHAVMAGEGPGAVMIIGDAGVGKSRLLYEFENWVELLPKRVYYFKARALATRNAVPYGMIRDLLGARFEIRDSDLPAAVAEKLRRGFAPYLSADEADLVGHWLGFDLATSPAIEQLRGAQRYSSVCAAHLARYLRALVTDHSVLLVLEDLHWADEESLDLLARMLGWAEGSPLLLVGAARPTLLERRPDWLLDRPGGSRHVLQPLSPATTRVLIADVLQLLPAVPEEVVALIVERADGNPFFVEELIKMFIDDGVVITGDPGALWEVDVARLDASSVPATLTGVLEARLDTLSRHDRGALQRASVVGRVFWEAAVGALAPTTPATDTQRSLDVARARELIFRSERPSLDVSDEYVFKHALLRDVTYETVLLRDRARLHALVADWLESNAGDRIGELLELVAEHRLLAGDLAAAADGFAAAATRALAAGRAPSAARLGDRALAIWADAGVEPPAEAVVRYTEACCRSGAYHAARTAFETLGRSRLSAKDEADALYYGSWAASEQGDRERERLLLERALPLAESVGGAVLMHVLLGRSWLASGTGDAAAAEADARRVLALAEAEGSAVECGRAWGALAVVSTMYDDHEQSLVCATRALDLARSVGDLEGESIAIANLGVSYHLRGDASGDRGDYELAGAHYGAHRDLCVRLDLPHSELMATLNLAQVALRLGDVDAAEASLRQAQGSPLLEEAASLRIFARMVDGDLLLHRGEVERGLRLLAEVHREPALRESDRQEIERVVARVGITLADLDAAASGAQP